MHLPRLRRGATVAFSLGIALACGGPPKPAGPESAKPAPVLVASAAPSAPSEPAARSPHPGKLLPVDDPRIELSVVAHALVGDAEIFEIALPKAETLASDVDLGTATWVTVSPADGTLAFLGYATIGNPPPAYTSIPAALRLWIRRPKSAAAVSGTFYTPASLSRAYSTGVHGHRIPFVASLPAAVPSPRDLERQWATSLATEFEMHPGVFYRFAAERMRIRYLGAKPGTPAASPTYRNESEFVDLM